MFPLAFADRRILEVVLARQTRERDLNVLHAHNNNQAPLTNQSREEVRYVFSSLNL